MARTAIITGASRGIGEATAREFAADGWNVVLLARSTEAVAEIAGEIGESALAVPCDVTKYAEVQTAINAAVDAFGSVEAMILNAGTIEPIAEFGETDPEGWAQAISVNLVGPYNCMRAALPVLPEGATVITIGSGAAHNALPGWSHYCSSKAGTLMLMKCLAREAPQLRVMSLSPGTVATQMQREIKASGIGPVAKLEWEDHVPPEWPARSLLWMCSPEVDEFQGAEIALRDEDIRRRIGLTE